MIEEATNIDKLRGMALYQYGYVTTSQATEAGVTRAALGMLNKRGRVERVAYGVYRIPQVPSTELDRFMLAVLWTGAEEAAISHETALDVYEICEVNPGAIHVTVSRGRRISRQNGDAYELHREDVAPADLTWWEGIPAVTPRKAIEQCIAYGTPTYLLRQAIDNGRSRGLILDKEARALKAMLETRCEAVWAGVEISANNTGGTSMDAWGDESIRVVCDPPVYLLAATYRTDGGVIDTSALEAMVPKGARKLHWRDMGDKTKLESMSAVSAIGASHTIVMGCRMPKNKQERARRKCLELMLPHLESLGITRYVLESRGRAKDGDDIALLMSLRSKGLCPKIDMAHEEGYKDSRLWVPDQVLGAYGDMRSGVGDGDAFREAWNRLSPSVTTMEIML